MSHAPTKDTLNPHVRLPQSQPHHHAACQATCQGSRACVSHTAVGTDWAGGRWCTYHHQHDSATGNYVMYKINAIKTVWYLLAARGLFLYTFRGGHITCYIHTHMHTHTYTHTCTHAHMHTHTYMHTQNTPTCIHTCVHAHITRAHAHKHMYTHKCTHTHVLHTRTCTHKCACAHIRHTKICTCHR